MRLSGTVLNGVMGAMWDHGRMSQLRKCRERIDWRLEKRSKDLYDSSALRALYATLSRIQIVG